MKLDINIKNFLQKINSKLKTIYNDEIISYRLLITFKLLSISIVTTAILFIVGGVILELDLIFFQANGYPGVEQFESLYYDYILTVVVEFAPYYVFFLFLIMLLGMYVSKLLLRPFKMIAAYCEQFVEGKDNGYDPDFYSELKLLTRFSEYFFNQIENAKKNNSLIPVEIPRKFTNIHRPVFETNFFIQYALIILAVSIASSYGLHFVSSEIYFKVISLAEKTIGDTNTISFFLKKQSVIFETITSLIIGVYFIAHIFFSIHLYGIVSGPAFAIFATMRSFIKGRYDAKVHLLGHYFLRDYCRTINRFLSYSKNEYVATNKKKYKKAL